MASLRDRLQMALGTSYGIDRELGGRWTRNVLPEKVAPGLVQADDRVGQLGRAPNRVDLLTRLRGVDFDGACSRRVGGNPGDVGVCILSLTDLIRNKQAAGRPQDIADAAALEVLHGPAQI